MPLSLRQKRNVSVFFKLLPQRNKITFTLAGFVCALLLNVNAAAQLIITTGSVSPTAWCASSGGAVSVPFTFLLFTGSNVFRAQLSDASGSFATTTALGNVTVNALLFSGGTINGIIPPGLTVSTHYRIRVVNTPLAILGSPNSNGELSLQAPVAKPASPSSGQQTDLCAGKQTTITVPLVSGVTYAWTIPVTSPHLHFVSTSTTNSVSLNVDANIGHELLNVTANNSCGASPVKDIHLWGHPTYPEVTGPTCVSADQQNIAFSVATPEADATYTWNVSGAIHIVSGQGTPTLTVDWKKSSGYVAVIGGNTCGNSGKKTYPVSLCAPLVSKGTAVTSMLVHVYPNPASSSAQISFTSNKETKYVIELTDKTGIMLQRKELIAHPGQNKLTLDLRKYTNGTYFVNVMGEGRRQAVQIVKTN